MIAFALVLLCLASANEALQCACSSPLCPNGQCTAASGGYCYRRQILDGADVVSETYGCFPSDDYYLCNSSSVVHMTSCCTAYDTCNNDRPLPPKDTSTASSVSLPGIIGRPLTCLQSNTSNSTANSCSVLSGFCYLLVTRISASSQYEQGCAVACDPQTTQTVQKSCCSTDLCNNLPTTTSPTTPALSVLYSCYCTAPGCNGVCVSTIGCYVDGVTGSQGCISSQEPCTVPNRTCCSDQWCNGWTDSSGATTAPSPPKASPVSKTTVNTTITPSTTSQSMQNTTHGVTRGEAGGAAATSDQQLVHSKLFQVLVAMVLILGVATVASLLIYIYTKTRSSKRPDPQLQQFIETSV